MSEFVCPFCHGKMEVGPQDAYRHMTFDNIMVERIKAQHPEWVASDGICPRCLEELKNMEGNPNG